jgi:predicted transcriptional regulator
MPRTQTLVQLTDDLVALLDEEAAERGVSRSALIREVLAEHLGERRRTSISAAIVDGYSRIPPATPDAWGDLERLTDQATIDLLQRLDSEEKRDGLEPW